jgi:hypothetical protein
MTLSTHIAAVVLPAGGKGGYETVCLYNIFFRLDWTETCSSHTELHFRFTASGLGFHNIPILVLVGSGIETFSLYSPILGIFGDLEYTLFKLTQNVPKSNRIFLLHFTTVLRKLEFVFLFTIFYRFDSSLFYNLQKRHACFNRFNLYLHFKAWLFSAIIWQKQFAPAIITANCVSPNTVQCVPV